MTDIHFTIGGKGGIGKTHLSVQQYQYHQSLGKTVKGMDTDPINTSFKAHTALNVDHYNVLSRGRIDREKFDELIEALEDSEEDVVIVDVGSSNFIDIQGYLMSESLLDALVDAGHTVTLDIPITGGSNLTENIIILESLLVNLTNDKVKAVVWLNEFQGPIEKDGKEFIEFGIYKKFKDSIKGVIKIPMLHDEQKLRTFERMTQEKLTYDEINENGLLSKIKLRRLNRIRDDIFNEISVVYPKQKESSKKENNKTEEVV